MSVTPSTPRPPTGYCLFQPLMRALFILNLSTVIGFGRTIYLIPHAYTTPLSVVIVGLGVVACVVCGRLGLQSR